MNKHLFLTLLLGSQFALFANAQSGNLKPDLEIGITSDHDTLKALSNIIINVTLWNRGKAAADRVVVSAPIVRGSLVYGGLNQATQGDYSVWGGLWDIGKVAAGDSAKLQLRVFLMDAQPFTRLVQVQAQSPEDLDSQPNNNTNETPSEDDEAVLKLPNTKKDCANDGTPPALLYCPETVKVTTTDSLAVAFWRNPSFSDNCDNQVLLESHYHSGDTFRLGKTNIVYFGKDVHNNKTPCVFDVVVEKIVGTGVDLALTMATDEASYKLFDYINYTLQVKNIGDTDAKPAVIDFKLPANTSYGGKNVATSGEYDLFFQKWTLDLKAGASATLSLRAYTLNNSAPTSINALASVYSSNPSDKNRSNNTVTVAIPVWKGANGSNQAEETSVSVKSVYPNPSSEFINVELVSKITGQVDLAVFNTMGERITNFSKNVVKGVNRFQTDVINFTSGVYFIVPMMEGEKANAVLFTKF
ncbi:MAG: hypothetical protein RLZZ628_1482 [Bacteroidota bacterium]|jgi:hypothetical protein